MMIEVGIVYNRRKKEKEKRNKKQLQVQLKIANILMQIVQPLK